MSHIEEVVKLRNRVEQLEEENRYLREELRPADNRWRTIKLRKAERGILSRLYKASPNVVTTESLINAFTGANCEWPENALKVYITFIRRKLEPLGGEVQNVFGVGYFLPPSTKAILDDIIAREAAQ